MAQSSRFGQPTDSMPCPDMNTEFQLDSFAKIEHNDRYQGGAADVGGFAQALARVLGRPPEGRGAAPRVVHADVGGRLADVLRSAGDLPVGGLGRELHRVQRRREQLPFGRPGVLPRPQGVRPARDDSCRVQPGGLAGPVRLPLGPARPCSAGEVETTREDARAQAEEEDVTRTTTGARSAKRADSYL